MTESGSTPSIPWPENNKGQSGEAVTYRKKREFLQLANLTKRFSELSVHPAKACPAAKRAQNETFYTLGKCLQFSALLLGLDVSVAQRERDPLCRTERYFTHHRDHRVAFWRGQSAGNGNGWT